LFSKEHYFYLNFDLIITTAFGLWLFLFWIGEFGFWIASILEQGVWILDCFYFGTGSLDFGLLPFWNRGFGVWIVSILE